MKFFLILTLTVLPSLSWAQSTLVNDPTDQGWDRKIAAKFYAKISNGRRLECCDKEQKSKRIEVLVELPDQCYSRMDFNLSRYAEESIDSTLIARAADLLEKKYLRQFPARKRARLARSCYWTYLSESLIEDLNQDAVFISGHLRVVICLQAD